MSLILFNYIAQKVETPDVQTPSESAPAATADEEGPLGDLDSVAPGGAGNLRNLSNKSNYKAIWYLLRGCTEIHPSLKLALSF